MRVREFLYFFFLLRHYFFSLHSHMCVVCCSYIECIYDGGFSSLKIHFLFIHVDSFILQFRCAIVHYILTFAYVVIFFFFFLLFLLIFSFRFFFSSSLFSPLVPPYLSLFHQYVRSARNTHICFYLLLILFVFSNKWVLNINSYNDIQVVSANLCRLWLFTFSSCYFCVWPFFSSSSSSSSIYFFFVFP